MQETFCDLSIETFERHRSSLTVERTEKPKKLKKQGSKYWYEISTKSYHFKRDEVEVEYLQTITKESVLAFYKEQIAMQGSARRKLSIHVMSKEAKDKGFEATDSSSTDGVQPVVIENVQSFRDLHSLYPVPPPYAEPVKLLQDAGTIQK
jgi:insulysin